MRAVGTCVYCRKDPYRIHKNKSSKNILTADDHDGCAGLWPERCTVNKLFSFRLSESPLWHNACLLWLRWMSKVAQTACTVSAPEQPRSFIRHAVELTLK